MKTRTVAANKTNKRKLRRIDVAFPAAGEGQVEIPMRAVRPPSAGTELTTRFIRLRHYHEALGEAACLPIIGEPWRGCRERVSPCAPGTVA